MYVDYFKLAGKTENTEPTWKISWKTLIWENQHHFLTKFFGCTQWKCKISNEVAVNYEDMFESRISGGAKKKTTFQSLGKLDAETLSFWPFDMEGHAKKCVERLLTCECSIVETFFVATICMDLRMDDIPALPHSWGIWFLKFFCRCRTEQNR